jgi:hypothetical protein
MPYELNLLAPNLLHVKMSGHVDVDTANCYYPEAWQKLDGCPRPTYIIMDARGVESTSPAARNVADKVRNHPNVGTIAFIVRQRYLLMFSPVMQFFSKIRLFGDDQEAIAFLSKEGVVAVPPDALCPDPVVGAGVTRPDMVGGVPTSSIANSVSSGLPASSHTGTPSRDVATFPTVAPPALAPYEYARMAPPQRLAPRLPGFNPVTGVVSFFTDMVEGLTRTVEDKPYISEVK